VRSLLSVTVAATLATSTANTYFMRGLGSTEQIALLNPAVSTYVDEVIIPRQNANNYTLFDVERVEVLRGPQGTTFGRNSTGGAISIVTRKPGKELGGYLTLGMGSYDSRLARGSVDVPLGERVLTKFSDRFTAILGARYTDETKEVDLRPTQYGGMTTADLREAGIDTDLDTSIVTPRLGLNFQASDDVMIYASATRGFKAGGWNSRTAYRPQEFQPMDPEKTWSYEAGFKSELLENRLRVNATVFYAETDDLQSSCTTPGPIAGTTLSTQNNAGDIDVKGVEFEFAAQLTDDLYVYGSAGFQDGEYSSTNPEAGSFCTNGGTVVDGACANPVPPATSTSYTNAIDPDDELSRLPERTFALGVNRDFPVAATGGKLRFTAEANYNSGYWTTASNATPTLRLIPGGPLVTPNALDTYADSYSLLNLSIGYESDGGRWRALIECKNCSDEEYLSSIFNGEFYGQPRRVNGSLTLSY